MYFTRTYHAYGYRINQVAAVKHLVENDVGWAKSYRIFFDHDTAMEAIAKKLSRESGLTLRALPLWLGSGRMGWGIVFIDDSMAPENRTSEGTKQLGNLERCMNSMGISEDDGPNLERLCSAMRLGYFYEPAKMAKQPPPPGWDRDVIGGVSRVLREVRTKLKDSQLKHDNVR